MFFDNLTGQARTWFIIRFSRSRNSEIRYFSSEMCWYHPSRPPLPKNHARSNGFIFVIHLFKFSACSNLTQRFHNNIALQ